MRGVSKVSRSVAARVSVIGLTIIVSACSTTDDRRYAGVHTRPIAQTASDQGWKTEIEEDGKPAQVPPLTRAHPIPDDPTQPWSPNYGRADGRPAQAPPLAPTAHPTWPKPIDTSARTSAAAVAVSRRLTEAEADAVMARAITAHERRIP
jgi:hypothetical protein